MKNVKIYENNEGNITAIVSDGEAAVNIIAIAIAGFLQEPSLPYAEFIAAAREGFPAVEPYDDSTFPIEFPIEDVAEIIRDQGALIATITDELIEVYPKEMGIAGEILFDLHKQG